MKKHNLSEEEFALLAAASPTDSVLPMRWWADFLTLFLGKTYTLPQARRVLTAYDARR